MMLTALLFVVISIPSILVYLIGGLFRRLFGNLFRDELVEKLEKIVSSCQCDQYATWYEASSRLDELSGMTKWRAEDASPFYDYRLLQLRYAEMISSKNARDVRKIIFRLRADLLRNLGHLGDERLYNKSRVGTKFLIEKYLNEVCQELRFVADNDFPDYSLQEKYDFFVETLRAYGRTALLLSGGAGFGMYHFGVIKVLFQHGLLPKVICGSSVGSIVAALVATRVDDDLPQVFEPGALNLEVFETNNGNKLGASLFRKLNRLLRQGVLMDIEKFQIVVRANIGDLTFQEAYEKTGRILNITVTASDSHHHGARLLNYLTSPNVLVWSAACASCALPGLFAPVALMARDSKGNIVPFQNADIKWSDGSIGYDIPLMRLAELFNINYVIVSQVNPHVVPFLNIFDSFGHSAVISSMLDFIFSEIRHRVIQITKIGLFPPMLEFLVPLITQKYLGDVTITPKVGFSDFTKLIANPSNDYVQSCIYQAQSNTWPKLGLIRNMTIIEHTLDYCVSKVRQQMRDEGAIGRTRSERNMASIDLSLYSSETRSMVEKVLGNSVVPATVPKKLDDSAATLDLTRPIPVAAKTIHGTHQSLIGLGSNVNSNTIDNINNNKNNRNNSAAPEKEVSIPPSNNNGGNGKHIKSSKQQQPQQQQQQQQ